MFRISCYSVNYTNLAPTVYILTKQSIITTPVYMVGILEKLELSTTTKILTADSTEIDIITGVTQVLW